MHLLAQDLVNGILAGGILAVVALGFSLVWGIMNIINLAHGAFIMLGAYVTWQLFTSFHLDPFLSIPISFAVLFVLGYLIQRFLINWVARAPVLTTFLLTFGLSLLVVNIALLIWTGDTRGVTTSYSGTNFTIAGITVPWAKLYTLIAAMVITGVMYLWLQRSKTGRAIRATSMDIGAAQLAGVRVAQIFAIVYGLGAGLAGVAGTLISLSYSLNPSMGQPWCACSAGSAPWKARSLAVSPTGSSSRSHRKSTSRSGRSTSAVRACRTPSRCSCCWSC
jgi:branched-chain amino acid transport system permease protein